MGKGEDLLNGLECLAIRFFEINDLSQVLMVEKESFHPGQQYDESVFMRYLDMKHVFLVADLCGKIIGYVLGFVEDSSIAHLASIAVSPSYRGLGIGRRLLEEFEKKATALGAKRIVLEVSKSNTVALNMYVKKGYRIVRRIPKYYGDEDAYLMIKDFKS